MGTPLWATCSEASLLRCHILYAVATDGDDKSRNHEIRIMMVCLGNICRSPMAASVLRSKLAAAGYPDIEVHSSGTSSWHVGEPADRRAEETLRAAGYDPAHTARQIQPTDLRVYDLVLAMDDDNFTTLDSFPAFGAHVQKFRSFDPAAHAASDHEVPDVPDPYYGGPDGFSAVLEMVERTCDEIVARIATGELTA